MKSYVIQFSTDTSDEESWMDDREFEFNDFDSKYEQAAFKAATATLDYLKYEESLNEEVFMYFRVVSRSTSDMVMT